MKGQSTGGEIKLFRTWIGWTQIDLAEWLNVKTSRITRWESNKVRPPVSVIYLLRLIVRKGIEDIGGPLGEDEVFAPIEESELEMTEENRGIHREVLEKPNYGQD